MPRQAGSCLSCRTLGPMELAPLEPRDAPGIAALWLAGAAESAAWDSSFAPSQSLAECIASVESDLSGNAYFGWGVLESSNRLLVGYLTARVEKPSREFRRGALLQLLDLDVQLNARRQGIGSRLVESARAHAQSASSLRVEVGWLSTDPQASAFWRRQGFSQYIARGQITFEPRTHGA